MATIVFVSTVAVAATTASIQVMTSSPPGLLSSCGLANPDIKSGRFAMLFEGFPRLLDERESGLVENLVVEAYNEITMGTNVAVTGCLDPLAREMQKVEIINQTLMSVDAGDLDPTVLEVLFNATVSCDRCSSTSPLFSEEQSKQNGAEDVNEDTDEEIVKAKQKRHRQLATVDFSSQKFFQRLIQLVIFETVELTDEGELPKGFVQISRAMVFTNDKEEEVLVTDIKYQRPETNDGVSGGTNGNGAGNTAGGDSRNRGHATFEFAFVDETGGMQKETIGISEEGVAMPTTAFPTFAPTVAPSIAPSIPPTGLPSETPSTMPSNTPSSSPSNTPSIFPSDCPSAAPSDSPSSGRFSHSLCTACNFVTNRISQKFHRSCHRKYQVSYLPLSLRKPPVMVSNSV